VSTEAGIRYRLIFLASEGHWDGHDTDSVHVKVDNAQDTEWKVFPVTSGSGKSQWKEIKMDFTAKGPTTIIMWSDGHHCIDVDDVRLLSCPAPATLTLYDTTDEKASAAPLTLYDMTDEKASAAPLTLYDMTDEKASCSKVTTNVGEQQREYSSVYANNAKGTAHARSMLNSHQAWSAKKNSAGQWMSMDLGQVRKVWGVVTQGRARGRWSNQYVKTYKVQYSEDGSTWKDVTGTYKGERGDSGKEAQFPQPVMARFVKLVVRTWSSHISMRAAAITCKGEPPQLQPPPHCKVATTNPAEAERSYSTVYNNDRKGTGHARSMLNAHQAWSAKVNRKGQWMSMDLGQARKVWGVLTQGRGRGRWTNQYVKNYKVQYSLDGSTWKDVNGLFYAGQGDEPSKTVFPQGPVLARYVKLVVETWNSHVSMRAAAMTLACEEPVVPVAPAPAPQESVAGPPISGKCHVEKYFF